MKKLLVLVVFALGMSSLSADGRTIYAKCVACHGSTGQSKAFGVVLNGQDEKTLVKKLMGYKAGTYGGATKGVMVGQTASLSPTQIKEVSSYIASFK